MTHPIERLGLWIDPAPHSAAWNMAVDEALLFSIDRPVLRFYRWSVRAVTFGYAQAYAPVAQRYAGWDMTRRWTGGGVVEHESDLTYSLAVPRADPLAHRPIVESYREIHRTLAGVLLAEGCDVALAGAPVSDAPAAACFAAPVLHDVVGPGGTKIAGAAQRRCRRGLLHQGSILGVQVCAGFEERFARSLAGRVEEFRPPATLEREIARLERERYGLRSWVCSR